MNTHLSEQQMQELLVDPASAAYEMADAQAHFAGCAACRSQFESLRDAVGLFRESVVAWGVAWGQQASLPAVEAPSQRRRWFVWATPAGAFAAAVLAVAFGMHHHTQQMAIMKQQAQQAAETAQLMQQMEQQLAQGEPSAMSPLDQLISTQDLTNTKGKN